MQWVACFSFALLSALYSVPVSAQRAGLRAHLQWERPAGSTCISGELLQRRVEDLLGRSAFVPARAADLRLHGVIEQRGDRWFASLAVIGEDGGPRAVRELHAEQDCAALNPALVVVLATLFDAPSEPGELEAGHERERDADGAGGDARLRLALGASGNLTLGLLPGLSAGGSVLLALRFAQLWPLWIDVSLWPAASQLDVAGRGARLQAAQLGAALCPELVGSARTGLALCAGGQAVAIRAQGDGLAVERAAVRGLGQLTAELALQLELWPSVHARLGLGAALALGRPRFYYERADGGRRILHRPAWIGGALRLGFIIGAR